MSGPSQSVDALDALLDFSEYDGGLSYQSPSLSPAASAKTPFARPVSAVTTPTMSQPQITGPSHPYEMYKQQTGIVPGALATTLAVNQRMVNNYNHIMAGLSPDNDLFDFNTDPSQASLTGDIDMDFDEPAAESSFFFPDTINPTTLNGQESPNLSSPSILPQTSNVGRLYPGMHSQAALAKAQAQQRQQQQIMLQQQQRQQQAAKPKPKGAQPTDPIVEQKITQLLNSMRAKSMQSDSPNQVPMLNIPRPKKDEDDMDEDERLLASEEGKKLSSKERRQLRNKVSARAFRSRRKEYITQLEAEIANKVSENGDLRNQNRALMEENKRLSDLTRMLLSSPSFSNFLDHLSTNPSAAPQASGSVKVEQRQEQRTVPKDVNPYTATQQQQIGMAMIPEQSMDFSMLTLDNDATFNFQPQVFAVLETPDVPTTIDTAILSGKQSNFVGEQNFDSDDKFDVPALERPTEKSLVPAAPEPAPVIDEEFENDPEFALYHASADGLYESAARDEDDFVPVDIFGGVEPEKIFARYELVDASEEEKSALLSTARIHRIAASLDRAMERLDLLSFY